MCLPGNSVLSSTKEDHQNKLLVTCYLNIVLSLNAVRVDYINTCPRCQTASPLTTGSYE